MASALHGPAYQNETGILLDFCIHYIRAVRCLVGEPESVYARGGADHILLTFDGPGWTAHVTLSWLAGAGRSPEFVVVGDQGALKIWPENRAVDLYPLAPSLFTRAASRVRPWWLRTRLMSPLLQRRRFLVNGRDRMGYEAELRDFLGATDFNMVDASSAIQGRRDVEIAMAAQESIEHHRPVRIKNTGSWLNPLPSSARPRLES